MGLFNIMQEGDIQIKGYPVRMALDVLLVFTANPEDYTARGKIITPLKDRIGSEIRTHYPATVAEGMSITSQESWTKREQKKRVEVPQYIREIVEEVAFQAREDKRVDRRSGVSQRLPISTLENVLSSAEQRAVRSRDSAVVARVADVYAAIPSMTGKFELEYEGELRGAENIARELIRAAVGKTFTQYFTGANLQPVIQWFELGGELKVPANASSSEVLAQLKKIQGLFDHLSVLEVSQKDDAAVVTSAAEFILEGLWAHKRINRSEERGYFADARKAPEPRDPREPSWPHAAPPVQLTGNWLPLFRHTSVLAYQMKYTKYSKYAPDAAEDIDLQELMNRLSDFFLQSGFESSTASTKWIPSARARK